MLEFQDNYKSETLKDIVLNDRDKSIHIFFGGNLDLYMMIYRGIPERIKEGNFNKKFEYLIKNGETEYQFFDRLVSRINGDNDIRRKRAKEELVSEDGTINWYSDDSPLENANLLSIKREDEGIKCTLYNNPSELHSGLAVRICNSGSRYDPFNVYFMKMFNEFQQYYKKSIEKNDNEDIDI